MDRLTSLTVFARVAESGGFSIAARRLNMSTTMVSNHVQTLEDHLGARLLNRTTRKVSLTEVGKAYYERAIRVLADLDEADRAVGELQSTPRGLLRLFTSGNLVRVIGPIVAEFLSLYPEVSIELGTGERMVDLVEEGVDLAIRSTPVASSSLIVRSLATWRHILCCSPRYLETHPAPKFPADLARHNCFRYTYYPYGDDWRFAHVNGGIASVRVSGNLISVSGDVLRLAALRGQGVFLAPSFVIGDEFETGKLVPLLPDYRPVEFSISALYPTRHHLSAKVRGFIDLLAQRIVEHRRWLDPDIRTTESDSAPHR